MIEKPYGKFTLDQFKELKDEVKEIQKLAPEFEHVIKKANPEKINSILGKDFSWYQVYEWTLLENLAVFSFVIGWQKAIENAAQADDPQQAFSDFLKSVDLEEEWQGGYQGLFEKKHVVGMAISLWRNIKSIMVYQKSLCTLIEEVRQGSDKALFDAVRIDRTIVACPSVIHRISMAELRGDHQFMRHLINAFKGRSKKLMVGFDTMRYMMFALVDTGADQLNAKNIEQLFVEHLDLYSKDPSAQKNLYKHYIQTKSKHPKKSF